MIKTTVYLPDDLKLELKRLAGASGRPEAELIREAIDTFVAGSQRPRPRGGLFRGDGTSLAEHADEALRGFGER
jgi:hypothetical protein